MSEKVRVILFYSIVYMFCISCAQRKVEKLEFKEIQTEGLEMKILRPAGASFLNIDLPWHDVGNNSLFSFHLGNFPNILTDSLGADISSILIADELNSNTKLQVKPIAMFFIGYEKTSFPVLLSVPMKQQYLTDSIPNYYSILTEKQYLMESIKNQIYHAIGNETINISRIMNEQFALNYILDNASK